MVLCTSHQVHGTVPAHDISETNKTLLSPHNMALVTIYTSKMHYCEVQRIVDHSPVAPRVGGEARGGACATVWGRSWWSFVQWPLSSAQNRQGIFLRIFFEEEPLMCLYTKNKKQLDKTLLINSHLQRMFGWSYPERCVLIERNWLGQARASFEPYQVPTNRLFWQFCGFEMPKYRLRTRWLHTLTLLSQ